MGVHSIDAIAKPAEVPGLEGKFSQARVVHFGESGPYGLRHLLVRDDFVDWAASPDDRESPKVAHGRSFELIAEGIKKATTDVELGGRTRRISVITQENSKECLKRTVGVEDELARDIGAAMKRVPPPKLSPGRDGEGHTRQPGPTKIAVYDVGQGDTIAVSFADGTLWIVDAYFWRKDTRSSFVTWLKGWSGRNTIDCLVLSHLHYDHIRSAEDIIRELSPREVVLAANFVHKTAAVRSLVRLCSIQRVLRCANSSNVLFESTLVSLVSARHLIGAVPVGSDPNNHGLLILLEGRRSMAVLPGDAPGAYLDSLAATGPVRGSRERKGTRFYKVTHHCSNTGLCPRFIEEFEPTGAATSCSFANRYNFPHSPARQRIEEATGPYQQVRGHGITWRDRSRDRCLEYELA